MSPVAPVLCIGPSSTDTPLEDREDKIWAMGVEEIRHKSAEPGVGRSALGSNSRPNWWRFI